MHKSVYINVCFIKFIFTHVYYNIRVKLLSLCYLAVIFYFNVETFAQKYVLSFNSDYDNFR